MMQLLWKTVWQFLKNSNVELPDDPGIPLVCTHDNLKQISTQKLVRECLSSIIHNSSKMEATQMSINGYTKRILIISIQYINNIHTMEYYWTIKRNKVLIHATTWMNLKIITGS